MDIIDIYVFCCSSRSYVTIYVKYDKDHYHYYRTDRFSLADERYPCIDSGRKIALVVAGTDLVCDSSVIDLKPGKQQFIYLFSVLKKDDIKVKNANWLISKNYSGTWWRGCGFKREAPLVS